jgi:hypothetical protein
MIEAMKQWLEVLEYWDIHGGLHQPTEDAITSLRQAIAELESQEPVAWMYEDDYQRMLTSETFCTVYSVKVGSPDKGVTDVPLYTTPPQRTWVGLTDDDEIPWDGVDAKSFAKAIEAKLKEKNT